MFVKIVNECLEKFPLSFEFGFHKILDLLQDYPHVTRTIIDAHLQQYKIKEYKIESINNGMIKFKNESMMLHSRFKRIMNDLLYKSIRFHAVLYKSNNRELGSFYVPTEILVLQTKEYQVPLNLLEDLELQLSQYTFCCQIIDMQTSYEQAIVTLQDTSGQVSLVLWGSQKKFLDLLQLHETVIIQDPYIHDGILEYGSCTVISVLETEQSAPKRYIRDVITTGNGTVYGKVVKIIPNDEFSSMVTIGLEIVDETATAVVYFTDSIAYQAVTVLAGHFVLVTNVHGKNQKLFASKTSKFYNLSTITTIPNSRICNTEPLSSYSELFYTDATIRSWTLIATQKIRIFLTYIDDKCHSIVENLDDFDYCDLCKTFAENCKQEDLIVVGLQQNSTLIDAWIKQESVVLLVSDPDLSKYVGEKFRFGISHDFNGFKYASNMTINYRIETVCEIPQIKMMK